MQCSGCKYPYSEVVYVTHDENNAETTRRRACLKCGLRFTTKERLKEPKRKNDPIYQRPDK